VGAVSGTDSDGRSPPSWLPKALAVAAVVVLVVYLGLFWTPPELGGTDDPDSTDPETEMSPTDGETTNVPTPQAGFDFEYNDRNGTVVVTHAGGDTFTAENTGELYVAVDGERRRAWSPPVSAGDSVATTLTPGREVSVIWVAPGGGESQVIGTFASPEPSTSVSTPAASFDFEYDGEEGTVSVTHIGGDRFDEENTGELYVVVDGDRRGAYSLPADAGDSVRVDAGPGQRVNVVWTPPDAAGRALVVGDFQIPE